MTSLYKPITLILEFYYMLKGLTFEILNIFAMLGQDLEIPCAKFQENRFGIDGEIDEKHALQIIVSYRL